ncbi:MAG TPA: alpha/beta fold hydrolase [Flavitalea sp.]|nr:alpha/beta fold hydrolase [Flavitalea sp.]
MVDKRKLFRWIRIVIIIYSLLGIVLYYTQELLLFHPKSLPASYRWEFAVPYRDVNIPYSTGSNMNVVQFQTAHANPKGVVLYFHGNRENINHYATAASLFTKNGYEVWMLDYPGFGKSTGPFTEKRLYEWALVFYKLARTRFEPGNIILYGRSMGTAVAAQLSSVRDCRVLILETPYYSFPSIFNSWLPLYPYNKMLHYEFPSWKFLQETIAPVVIFHGTNDRIIPFRNAEKLVRFLKKSDRFIQVTGASHNDVTSFTTYTKTIDSLLMTTAVYPK